jgi:hypothetical protein
MRKIFNLRFEVVGVEGKVMRRSIKVPILLEKGSREVLACAVQSSVRVDA